MGQLFYRNLHLEFFERFPKNTTDFLAVSGYLGPDPLTKLETLPFNSRVMYGLQRETPNLILHNQLKKIHFGSQKLNFKRLAFFHKILFSAGFDDCEIHS